jgi:excisionase family DNA binding protein
MRHKPEPSPIGLLSVEAAAEFLGGLSPSTIRGWLSQKKLTRVKIGSRTMVRESELLALIQPEGKRK